MAIYDNLPYTNFHELNADWLLKQMKEAKAKIDEYQETLDQFEEDYNVLLGLAGAMTVAGSNVTVAGTLSAGGLIGNLTGNVTGNLTGNVTGNVTGDVTGDLTGNVTGNVTGDVTGNADTATYATSAGSASTASSASSASSAAYAVEASFATEAESLTWHDDITSSDMNDYIDPDLAMALYKGANLTTNIPAAITSGASAVILSLLAPSNSIMQCAWFYAESLEVYVRFKYGGSWQAWRKFTLA